MISDSGVTANLYAIGLDGRHCSPNIAHYRASYRALPASSRYGPPPIWPMEQSIWPSRSVDMAQPLYGPGQGQKRYVDTWIEDQLKLMYHNQKISKGFM